jgi:hypothetical protein
MQLVHGLVVVAAADVVQVPQDADADVPRRRVRAQRVEEAVVDQPAGNE